MTDLGKCLSSIRELNDESLEDMASKLALPTERLRAIENGYRSPTKKMLRAITQKYALSPQERKRVLSAAEISRATYTIRVSASTSLTKHRLASELVKRFDNINDESAEKMLAVLRGAGTADTFPQAVTAPTVPTGDMQDKRVASNGKYYAVRNGRQCGIFRTWDDCKAQVHGYPDAEYKSFFTEEEADAYLEQGRRYETPPDWENEPYAYVDGSVNDEAPAYGWGGILHANGETHEFSGSGSAPDLMSMRNVAGECMGAVAATEMAIKMGLPRLAICHDYNGIREFATGGWTPTKPGTIWYADRMKALSDEIELRFYKVRAHTGVPGNEVADRLAKKAVGIVSDKNRGPWFVNR